MACSAAAGIAVPTAPVLSQPKVQAVVNSQLGALKQLDADVFEYVGSMLADVESHDCDEETLQEAVETLQEARWDLVIVVDVVARYLCGFGLYLDPDDQDLDWMGTTGT
ncbi:hypothetical protein JKP88DRAFT_275573 [Tribonema minus]|uniref:Uncharacterized protein n=1 Tax=Tribonema minus TaxID=303371 RepID=A0A835Z7G8_9STRA|nr:hypothetical protein JKP88DRAFT_275573 [Tribonema minus]